MESLRTPPLPLTRAQWLLFGLTTFSVALTRLLARARTLWDWDEVQFALAVEDYDVGFYQPHPPGFPLFILLAKLVRPVVSSDFQALQAVTLTASMAVFPVVFLLCRELRFPFATAWSGALLTSFLPSVWFFGGTAFSDIPSLVLTIAACALLLRGIRHPRSLLVGAALLGLAASIRPQALLTGAAPALVAVWHWRRQWRQIVPAMAVGAGILIISYGGAALASSSVAEYVEAGRKLRQYLRQVDSFLSPDRPPLGALVETFFVRVIPGDRYARVVLAGALAGAVVAALRRQGHVLLLVAMFLPFQIFAWLMLDYHSVTRYGVSFVPLYAILAAAAAVGIVSLVPGLRGGAGAVLVLLLSAALARWSWPALAEVRHNPSPPHAAMQWVNDHVPRSATVYVHGSVVPFARYFIRNHEQNELTSDGRFVTPPPPGPSVVVAEPASPANSAQRFVRPRARLFDLVRRRYFEVTVLPAKAWAEFGEGWHGLEWEGATVWTWMGERSEMRLPPLSGRARLRLGLEPALEKGAPIVEVMVNGQTLDRFAAEGPVDRSWMVDASPEGMNEVVITADRSVNPARDGYGEDGRDLSLRLVSYDWTPVP